MKKLLTRLTARLTKAQQFMLVAVLVAGSEISIGLWAGSKLPYFRDWPVWVLVSIGVLLIVTLVLWLRQSIEPDGTMGKPKWY
jgi:hypothetical protein